MSLTSQFRQPGASCSFRRVWARDNLPDCTRPEDLWTDKQFSPLELGYPPCSSSGGGGNSSVTYTRRSSCCHNISGWISTAASAALRHHGYLRGPTIGWKAKGGGCCCLLCCCEACNNWAGRQSTPRSMAQTGLSRQRSRYLLVCLIGFPCIMRGSTEQCCTASLPILIAPPLPQQSAALLPGCTKAPCMQAGATTNAP